MPRRRSTRRNPSIKGRDKEFAGRTGAWWLKVVKVRKKKDEIRERRWEKNKRDGCGSGKRRRTSRRG